ncbi:MAG: hypothetical protein J0L97_04855, partial [Alphaproteobacteria bacterium]|nr:hypothetical protein [Alphaproteobacteria bacterium]
MSKTSSASEARPGITRHLDVSRKADITDQGAVTVKLALSSSEAGALRLKAAQDGRIQVDIDPVTGVVTITGDAALVQAALQDVQLEIAPGFAKTFKMDMHVSQGGSEHHEQLILYFESASNRHVPMDGTGSGASWLAREDAHALSARQQEEDERVLHTNGRTTPDRLQAMPTDDEENDDTPSTALLTLPPVELRPGYVAPAPLPVPAPAQSPPVSVAPPSSEVPEPVTPPSSSPAPVTPPVSGGGTTGAGGTAAAGRSFTLTPGIDNLIGDIGDDTFFGSAADLAITDTVTGATGNDLLQFTGGVLNATTGAGVMSNVTGIENIQLNSNGAHVLNLTNGYFGGSGFVTGMMSVSTTSNVGITVSGFGVSGIYSASLSGASGADSLYGTDGADTIA